jgi:hypothetical protein
MADVVAKIKNSASSKIEGDLAFLNNWSIWFDGKERHGNNQGYN